MSDKLKKFVSDNKHEFDSSEPSKDLWQKLDSNLGVKDVSGISSKWLSKFKYLAFGTSVLIIAIYFIVSNFNNSSVNEIASNRKDSANNSERLLNANQNRPELNGSGNHQVKNDVSKNKNLNSTIASSLQTEKKQLVQDSILTANENSIDPTLIETEDPNANTYDDKNDITSTANKKELLYIPETPSQMNVYTATLYKGASFCSMVRAFKFPGTVSLYTGETRNAKNHRAVMRTMSCSRLSSRTDLKAVWLKGKTTKEIKIAVKEGFKTMYLLKKDGKKIHPEAMSHYYPGVGIITEYKGKYFNMRFKDEVGLILFFKEIEEGDKVIIDDQIEAMVQDQP